MSGILFLVTGTLALLSGALFLPVLVAFAIDDLQAVSRLGLLAILGSCLSLMMVAAIWNRIRALNRSQSLLAVVLVWLICPLAGAIPFMTASSSLPLIALFESVSGLTTTGATTFQRDGLPLPLVVWRCELEWIGGFIILASVIHVLAPAGVGGLPRSGGRFFLGEHDLKHTVEVGRFVRLFAQYSIVTLVIMVLFLLTGVEGLNALFLAMTAVSTGGFLPFGGSLHEQVGALAQLLFAIVLAVSATSLLWQRLSFSDLWLLVRQNREAQWVAAIIGVLTIIISAKLVSAGQATSNLSPLTTLNDGFFMAASIVSTSAIEPRQGVVASLPILLLAFTVLAGASVFSTAGGIKLYRVGGMLLQANRELSLLIYPNSVGSSGFSGNHDNQQETSAVWSVFILAIFVIVISTVLICFQSGFEAGITMAVSLFANAGPLYSASMPETPDPQLWPTYGELETIPMAVAILIMILGRLEILVIFAAFNISYWSSR